MTRTAHFDLVSGISGDMAIAALVDAGRRSGTPVEGAVSAAIESLGLDCTVSFIDDDRSGFACVRTEIKAGDARHTPDALRAAIERSEISDPARTNALAALEHLVSAEANVHGVDTDAVHLHELASGDTAADLAGACAAMDALDIGTITASAVPIPSGSIESEHGRLPLPAPVSVVLLEGALVRGVPFEKELVTPTGAALLKTFVDAYGPVPRMRLIATGVGGGTRIEPAPNICRVLLGDAVGTYATEACVVLETNIDDQTPEALGHALDVLLEEGALDAWVTNIAMKKSRPAFLLSVLVRPDDEARLTETLFRHTTTLGVRRRESTRAVLDREFVEVPVRGQTIRVKLGRLAGDVVNIAPEFGDCIEAERRTGVPAKVLYGEAQDAAREI